MHAETQAQYGVALGVVNSCLTRWSTDYFMLRHNLRIKAALVSVTVNERMFREFRTNNNAQVKQHLLSEEFWQSTEKAAKLLHPLSTTIRYSEGDKIPLSAIPKIWAHIDNQSCNENLQEDG